VRARLDVSPKVQSTELEQRARADEAVVRALSGREIVNVIVREPKLVSFATKPLAE
jgi:leucyl-tRNA synthetase